MLPLRSSQSRYQCVKVTYLPTYLPACLPAYFAAPGATNSTRLDMNEYFLTLRSDARALHDRSARKSRDWLCWISVQYHGSFFMQGFSSFSPAAGSGRSEALLTKVLDYPAWQVFVCKWVRWHIHCIFRDYAQFKITNTLCRCIRKKSYKRTKN